MAKDGRTERMGMARVRSRRKLAGIGAALAAAALLVWAGSGRAEQRVDLNRASVSELATLPGIGEAKAQAIVAHREATPFRSVDDLREVKGIGDKLLEQLRDRVEVSGAAGAARAAGGAGGAAPKSGAPASRPGTAGGAGS